MRIPTFTWWAASAGLVIATMTACSGGTSTNGATSLVPSVPVKRASGAIPRHYVLTDLGTQLPGSPGLVPTGVNDKGVVVGEASVGILSSLPSCSPSTCGPPEGWIYQNGTLSELPALGSDFLTFADDINNVGVVSGGSAGSVTEEAILWNRNGGITNLGTGILGSGSSAEATSISNASNIVGVSYDSTSEIPTAFDGNGGASAPCGSSTQGILLGTNDNGQSAGELFLSAGGVAAMTCPPLTVIESPPDPTFWDLGFDVNDKGQAVGRISPGPSFGNFYPFLYQNGTTTNLGTLFPGNPSANGAAFSINQSGMIVGFSGEGGGVPGQPPIDPRAFVYSNGQMIDLNSLLSSADQANWTVVVAAAVNDKKQIVCSAFYGGYPNGVEHAVLLSPEGLAPKGVSRHVHVSGSHVRASREVWTRIETLRAKRLRLER